MEMSLEFDSLICYHPHGIKGDWPNLVRQLKPGAHVVSITPLLEHHRVTAAMEDCGLEIRDCIMFLGTPSYMIALGRLPLEGTVAENVLKHGTGALNIDIARVETTDTYSYPNGPGGKSHHYSSSKRSSEVRPNPTQNNPLGRWPANVVVQDDESIKANFPETQGRGNLGESKGGGGMYGHGPCLNSFGKGDSGSTARFFHNFSEDNVLLELMNYMCKLCTPSQGNVMVVNVGENAIMRLRSQSFSVSVQ
jgi:hypothetical protein